VGRYGADIERVARGLAVSRVLSAEAVAALARGDDRRR
jgi:hypothetical protein